MARRIRWQIVVAVLSSLVIVVLLGHLALATADEGGPEAGGTYIEALVGVPQRINPIRASLANQPEADLSGLIFEGLTRAAPDGRPLAALAESWEQSADGQVYTFTLRTNVVWHDGHPFGPADVVFTYQALADPELTEDPALQSFWHNVLVDQLDSRRVRFRLAAPFAPFLNQTTVGILPAHLLKDRGPEVWKNFERQPIGTGPYRLVEITESQAILKVNADYYDPVAPYLDQIIFRFYPSLAEAHAALVRNEAHGLGYNVTEIGELSLPPRFERFRAPLAGYTLLSFNLRQPLLSDLNVRQALAFGLDKDQLIKHALKGLALRLDLPILNSSWGGAPSLGWYPPAADEARRLLAAAGWQPGPDGILRKDGQPLHLPLLTTAAQDRIAAAQEIARQWRVLGILVEIQQVNADELRQRLTQHDFTIALHGWARLGSDPDIYEFWHSSQVEANNVAGLVDEELDRLLASARRIARLEDRAALYRQALKRWSDLAPSIMLYQPLYEQMVASEVNLVGLTRKGIDAPVLYSPEDRFRFLTTGWYLSKSRKIRTDLRNTLEEQRPR